MIATNSVITAETTFAQEDVNVSRTLVNGLTEDDDKSSLNERLNIVQSYINQLGIAISANFDAQTIGTQQSIDVARILVNQLKDKDRNDLNSELDNLQNDLNYEINYPTLLNSALTAVINSEVNKTQQNIDSAKIIIDSLKDSDKNSLIIRIDEVQKYVDLEKEYAIQLTIATNSVINAEDTKQKLDIDNARVLVEGLKDDMKNILNDRLDIIQDIINNQLSYDSLLTTATDSVKLAEITKLQSDVDYAKSLVESLHENDKTELIVRIGLTQSSINIEKLYQSQITDAKVAVAKAESTMTSVDVNNAKILISCLHEVDRPDLMDRINIVQLIINEQINYQTNLTILTNLVIKAEASITQIDINNARNAITLIYQSNPKIVEIYLRIIDISKLTGRLNNTQNIIDNDIATNAVINAENTKLQVDITYARIAINILQSESVKSTLNGRLDIINSSNIKGENNQSDIDSANQKVSMAEKYPTVNYYYNQANSSIAILKPCIVKDSLILRLIIIKDNQVKEANVKVTNAENSQLKSDIDLAKSNVDSLNETTSKTLLLSRLNAIVVIDNNLNSANNSILTAEQSMYQPDIDKAKTIIETLIDNIAKNYLTNRLNAIAPVLSENGNNNQSTIDTAVSSVSNAEKYKTTMYYFQSATGIVNLLLNCQKKDYLLTRLMAFNDSEISNALNAIDKSNISLDEEEVNYANSLVNNLSNEMAKYSLKIQINDVINKLAKSRIDNVTQSIITSEKSNYQSDIDYSRSLLLKLDDSPIKNSLVNRLNVIIPSVIRAGKNTNLTITNATDSVLTAEKYKTTIYYQLTAMDVVSSLLNCDEKEYLLTRLMAFSDINIFNAIGSVDKANLSLENTDVDLANQLVNSLVNEVAKNSLTSYIRTIKGKIIEAQINEATQAVIYAENSCYQPDIESAQKVVSFIQDTSVKGMLLNRIDKIIPITALNGNNTLNSITNITEKVYLAEKYITTPYYYQSASDYVNSLKGCVQKDYLLSRLIAFSDTEVSIAIIAVDKANLSMNQKDVDLAKPIIENLSNVIAKRGLLSYLVTVNNLIIDKVKESVQNAEDTGMKADINLATIAISTLIDITLKDILTNRLKAIITEDNDFIIDTEDTLESSQALMDIAESKRTFGSRQIDSHLELQSTVSLYLLARTTNVVGGLVLKNAGSFLRHSFFSHVPKNEKLGTKKIVNVVDMLSDSPMAKDNMINDIKVFIKSAEYLARDGQCVNLVSKNEQSNNKIYTVGVVGFALGDKDWEMSLHGYRTFINGGVSRHGDIFQANIQYNIRDFYDWANDNQGVATLTNAQMYKFHQYGLVKEYRVEGHCNVIVSWHKGEVINANNIAISTQ